MTRLEIVNFVCGKVGQTDADSKALCVGFVNTRYRMIYDAELWTDTRATSSLTLASGGIVAMPDTLERIIAVRSGTEFLDPILEEFLMETDPATLTGTTGTAKFYKEYRDDAGGRGIRVFPAVTGTINVIAKRTWAPLAIDAAVPLLRGIDNALIAYAMGDMLERQRQYAKAQAKFQEAGAHLEALRKLEAEQAAAPRRAKALSTAGDSLGEMADDVAARLGDYSPAARVVIKNFLRRAWNSVADSFPWRDLRAVSPVSLSSGTSLVDYPTNLARVTAVLWGDVPLAGVTMEYLAQSDPAALTASGPPRYFTTGGDTRKFSLFPIPNVSAVLAVIGRRETPVLSAETDRPTVRGLGSVLALCALGDALMARNDGRAAAAKQEAMALLKQARDAEGADAFRQRQATRVTDRGDTLAEMTEEVAARVGNYSPETLAGARHALRRAYRALWDARLWQESMVVVRATSDGPTLLLPGIVERVASVRADAGSKPRLDGMAASMVMDLDPATFDAAPGTPTSFSVLSPAAVAVLPAPGGKLKLVSSDNSDHSPVFIRGETAGVERTETVRLNGTATVLTSGNFDVPLTLAKAATAGTITVTNAAGDLTLLALEPDERERKHVRLWLHPGGDCGATYLVLAKRRARGLLADQDTPQIRDCAAALIARAAADLAGQMGDAKAVAYQGEADAAVKTLGDLEESQSLRRRQARRRSGAGDTLADLADDVAARVGDYSPETLDAIKQSLRRHARTVWDEFLWRDSIQGETLAAPGGAVELNLPGDVDRVLSVRSDQRYLDLVPLSFLNESDPDIFGRTAALPDYAVELRANAGAARQLALYPAPTGSLSLGLVYKRAMPAFTADADLLPLREGSAALVAMAAADAFMLLDRGAAAETSRADGQERLVAMQKAEIEQGARARRARRRNATGDTLGDLIEEVCARLGTFDPGTQTLARSAVRRAYRWLWDTRPWSDASIFASVSTVAGTAVLTFAAEWERVSAVVINGRPLDVTDLATLWRLRSDALTATGRPTAFYTLPPAVASDPVKVQLFPAPTMVEPYTAAGKRRCPDLINDTDTPLLRGCGSALVALGTAEMLAGAGDAKGAEAVRAQATGLIAALVDGEVNQGAHIVQIIPTVEAGAYFSGGEGLFW